MWVCSCKSKLWILPSLPDFPDVEAVCTLCMNAVSAPEELYFKTKLDCSSFRKHLLCPARGFNLLLCVLLIYSPPSGEVGRVKIGVLRPAGQVPPVSTGRWSASGRISGDSPAPLGDVQIVVDLTATEYGRRGFHLGCVCESPYRIGVVQPAVEVAHGHIAESGIDCTLGIATSEALALLKKRADCTFFLQCPRLLWQYAQYHRKGKIATAKRLYPRNKTWYDDKKCERILPSKISLT